MDWFFSITDTGCIAYVYVNTAFQIWKYESVYVQVYVHVYVRVGKGAKGILSNVFMATKDLRWKKIPHDHLSSNVEWFSKLTETEILFCIYTSSYVCIPGRYFFSLSHFTRLFEAMSVNLLYIPSFVSPWRNSLCIRPLSELFPSLHVGTVCMSIPYVMPPHIMYSGTASASRVLSLFRHISMQGVEVNS